MSRYSYETDDNDRRNQPSLNRVRISFKDISNFDTKTRDTKRSNTINRNIKQ